MTRFQTLSARPVLTLLGLSLCLASPLLAQRSDRGIIGGVVTDAQGAGVPGATVTVRNEATGVETVLVTNSAGAYTTAPLVLGPYSVTVNLSGFKKAVSSGIVLRAGDVVRHDVTLQIGEMTESVEVTGGERARRPPGPTSATAWTRSTTRTSRSSPPPTSAWPSRCS